MTQLKLVRTTLELIHDFHKKCEAMDGAAGKYREARIEAGQILLDLKRRVDAGELGEVKWWAWYDHQFTRSREDAEKWMRIAGSDDPPAAAETATIKNREYQRSFAQRRKSVLANTENSSAKSRATLRVVPDEPAEASFESDIQDVVDRFFSLPRGMWAECLRRIKQRCRED
jgi:hypothetical protein